MSAIETLVMAMSLIKQSKIANDERNKLLISSLQDTLKGIEDKYYGGSNRVRSNSRDSRDRYKNNSQRRNHLFVYNKHFYTYQGTPKS